MLKNVSIFLMIIAALSCSSSNDNVENSHSFAAQLYTSAQKQLLNKQYEDALNNFASCYEISSLKDNIELKFKSSLAISKIKTMNGDSESAVYWFEKAKVLSQNHDDLKQYIILHEIENMHVSEEHSLLIQKIENLDLGKLDNDIVLQIFSYKLNSEALLNQSYSETYIALEKILAESLTDFWDDECTDPSSISFGFYTLGKIDFNNNNLELAGARFNQALKIDKAISNTRGIADDLFQLGKIEDAKGNSISAENYFLRANDIYRLLGDEIPNE